MIIPENFADQGLIGKIKLRLSGLGVVGVRIGEPKIGPLITGYPLILPDHVSIKSVMSKSEDLALALNAEGIDIRRIGREVIVFVPNENRKVIDFKDALFWYLKDEEVAKMTLPILLGMDFMGHNSVIDLSLQPHMLIAGSTGSGKSVFESAIIASLAMKKSVEELQLYLVDTKGLDLTQFAELPHVNKMVTTIEEWYEASEYIFDTIKSRNMILSAAKARNITEYNANLDANSRMPHIVIIIDELADLVERDKAKIQEDEAMQNFHPYPKVIDSLQRIIQICRASGIHIIACTQRADVKTVNGTVKANFPTRIALRLPTGTDSRTIIGQNGAESLLGKGDMLVQHSDNENVERFHGPFVRLEDIELILNQREMILKSLNL